VTGLLSGVSLQIITLHTHGFRETHFVLNRHRLALCSKSHLAIQRHQVSPCLFKVTRRPVFHPSLSLAPLRSSERRKLRARTAERFRLAPEVAENLVPEGLLSQKYSAYNSETGVRVPDRPGRSIWLYCNPDDQLNTVTPQVLYLSGDGDPLWFSVGKGSDELIPTGTFSNVSSTPPIHHFFLLDRRLAVYTLWKHPTLLPVLTTPASVIPVLIGGADLMVPGGTRDSFLLPSKATHHDIVSHPSLPCLTQSCRFQQRTTRLVVRRAPLSGWRSSPMMHGRRPSL
jgi:hypothetical protein